MKAIEKILIQIFMKALAFNFLLSSLMLPMISITQCIKSLLRLMNWTEGFVLSKVILVLPLFFVKKKKRGTDDEALEFRQLYRKFLMIKNYGWNDFLFNFLKDLSSIFCFTSTDNTYY